MTSTAARRRRRRRRRRGRRGRRGGGRTALSAERFKAVRRHLSRLPRSVSFIKKYKIIFKARRRQANKACDTKPEGDNNLIQNNNNLISFVRFLNARMPIINAASLFHVIVLWISCLTCNIILECTHANTNAHANTGMNANVNVCPSKWARREPQHVFWRREQTIERMEINYCRINLLQKLAIIAAGR